MVDLAIAIDCSGVVNKGLAIAMAMAVGAGARTGMNTQVPTMHGHTCQLS